MGVQGSALAEVRARRALADARLDSSVALERASSVTNEVWVSARHVIRVNRTPSSRLQREARLTPALPREVRYPRIVAQGGQAGKDWLIHERTPGRPLAHVWPSLDRHQRRSAIATLATMLRAVHATAEPEELEPPVTAPHLLGLGEGATIDPLRSALRRAAGLEHVDARLLQAASALVEELAPAIEPFTSTTLIHGDLTLENVLWHEGELTAMLDFEWSRAAPPDLDLDIVLRFCAFPFLHVAPAFERETVPEDYREVPWWLREDYPELFARPGGLNRMRLYSLSYDVRELVAHPPRMPARELSPYHPHHRIRAVVDAHSYLDQLHAA